MNDFSNNRSDIDYGILELSSEEIELVNGGTRLVRIWKAIKAGLKATGAADAAAAAGSAAKEKAEELKNRYCSSNPYACSGFR